MLRWRLLLGTLIIGALAGACWLDHHSAVAGLWLLPIAVLFTVGASQEILWLARENGKYPPGWVIHGGNLLILVTHWIGPLWPSGSEPGGRISPLGWPLLGLAAGLLAAIVGEMGRYEKPGQATANVAAAVFGLVYVGGMLGFVVQLRVAPWGSVAALAASIAVVKLGDTGAYLVGRLIGRRKMAPLLSPGKTVEGASGAILFACLGSGAIFNWIIPWMEGGEGAPLAWWRWLLFGLLLGGMGLLGDLAESMFKRDAGRKDSSPWLPGFGGVLDILDSILLAAPVAWLCWVTGLVW